MQIGAIFWREKYLGLGKCGVTVAYMYQEENISGIEPHIQSNDLYAWLLVALKAKQTWVDNSRKENTTPHPFGTFPEEE